MLLRCVETVLTVLENSENAPQSRLFWLSLIAQSMIHSRVADDAFVALQAQIPAWTRVYFDTVFVSLECIAAMIGWIAIVVLQDMTVPQGSWVSFDLQL